MPDKTKDDQPQATAKAATTAAEKPVLKFTGGDDGRYFAGVPRRDLYAEDVRGLNAEQRRSITAKGPGGKALYQITDEKAYRAALKGADKE